MKALIKGSLCLALAWLANGTGAQEIQFKKSSARNPNQPAVVAPQEKPAPSTADTGLRPVTLQQPIQQDNQPTGSFRPLTPTVRGQVGDDKTGIPKLEILVGEPDPKAAKPLPKDEKKDDKKFVPPPPNVVTPAPIMDSLGINGCDDGCGVDACCGSRFGGLWQNLCRRDSCDRQLCWFSAEYLMWWQRSQSVPPLVTSSPAGTATINSGVLGANGTSVLYDTTPTLSRGGARFDAGIWLPRFCNLGLEFNYFFLGRDGNDATYGGNGDPQIARPFFNAVTNQQAAQIVAINNPDRFVTGTVTVHDYSQLWGFEAMFRRKWHQGCNYYIDLTAGYRHLTLNEGISITENLQNIDPRTGAPAGNFLVKDSFATRNQFNGIQFGFDSEFRFWNRMFLGVTGKIAFGNVHQTLNIDGSTTFSNFGIPTSTFPGGLLALPGTNIGTYSDNRFGFVPEIGLKVGVDITDNLRLYAGYNFLYLNTAIRPGDQIDVRVNPNFQPNALAPGVGGGPRVPAVLFRASDYWAQGFSVGLMYRY